MKKAAISYFVGQTGMKEEDIDLHEEITVAILCIISDMWDNRSATTNNDKRNPTVEAIISMHSMNLLPTPDKEAV